MIWHAVFFQVAIPSESRAKFRFLDRSGQVYEMNVMPMGHRCAPELMHSLTATIAGDPAYCNKKSAFAHNGLDVYIDGIRYASSDKNTQEYAAFIDRRAQHVNARFKEVGVPPLQNYTFNGVNYHHRSGKVALGPKITRRLQNDNYMHTTYSGLVSRCWEAHFCFGNHGHTDSPISSILENCPTTNQSFKSRSLSIGYCRTFTITSASEVDRVARFLDLLFSSGPGPTS